MITILTLLGCSPDAPDEPLERHDIGVPTLEEPAPVPMQAESFELVFHDTPGTLDLEHTHQLVVQARKGGEPTEAGLVTYESLNPAVVTVDAAGLATAKAAGIALLKARTAQGQALVEIEVVAP